MLTTSNSSSSSSSSKARILGIKVDTQLNSSNNNQSIARNNFTKCNKKLWSCKSNNRNWLLCKSNSNSNRSWHSRSSTLNNKKDMLRSSSTLNNKKDKLRSSSIYSNSSTSNMHRPKNMLNKDKLPRFLLREVEDERL